MMKKKIRPSFDHYSQQCSRAISRGEIVQHTSVIDVEGREGLRVNSFWMVDSIDQGAAERTFKDHNSLPEPEVSLLPFKQGKITGVPFFLKLVKDSYSEKVPISFFWPFSERRAWTLREGGESIFEFCTSGFQFHPEEISTFFFPEKPEVYLYEIDSPKITNIFNKLHINKYIDKGFDLQSEGKRRGYHFLWNELETLSPGKVEAEGFNITTYLTLV